MKSFTPLRKYSQEIMLSARWSP